VQEFFF